MASLPPSSIPISIPIPSPRSAFRRVVSAAERDADPDGGLGAVFVLRFAQMEIKRRESESVARKKSFDARRTSFRPVTPDVV